MTFIYLSSMVKKEGDKRCAVAAHVIPTEIDGFLRIDGYASGDSSINKLKTLNKTLHIHLQSFEVDSHCYCAHNGFGRSFGTSSFREYRFGYALLDCAERMPAAYCSSVLPCMPGTHGPWHYADCKSEWINCRRVCQCPNAPIGSAAKLREA